LIENPKEAREVMFNRTPANAKMVSLHTLSFVVIKDEMFNYTELSELVLWQVSSLRRTLQVLSKSFQVKRRKDFLTLCFVRHSQEMEIKFSEGEAPNLTHTLEVEVLT
jgi:predicted transcriptional regulator